MDKRIGQKIGSYQLISQLGTGGFADVYLGEHEHMKRQAAIKILNTRLSRQDGEAFIEEANTLARLEHAHIIRVLDCGFADKGIPFIIMEYARNGTLRNRHPKGSQIGLTTLLSYARPVADALQYAHERKIIHRDVKPENMLLDHHDQLLLSDFGMAVVFHHPSSSKKLNQGGTIPYMAPEQSVGKPQFASDQYALGVVVYEWLCGKRPFQGTETEILAQHLHTSPPPLHPQVPWLPARIEEVVFRALAKDPRERYPSISAFVAALEEVASSDNLASGSLSTRILSPAPVSTAGLAAVGDDPALDVPQVDFPASLDRPNRKPNRLVGFKKESKEPPAPRPLPRPSKTTVPVVTGGLADANMEGQIQAPTNAAFEGCGTISIAPDQFAVIGNEDEPGTASAFLLGGQAHSVSNIFVEKSGSVNINDLSQSARPEVSQPSWMVKSEQWPTLAPPEVPASLPKSRGLLSSSRLSKRMKLWTMVVLLLILIVAGAGLLLFEQNPAARGVSANSQSTRSATSPVTTRTPGARATPKTTPAPQKKPTRTPVVAVVPTPTPTAAQPTAPAQPKGPPTEAQILNWATSGSPLVSDSLSQNNGNWQTYQVPYSTCAYNGGGLVATSTAHNRYTDCFAQNVNLTNFAFQAQSTVQDGDSGGIIFRAINSSSYYSYTYCVQLPCTPGHYGVYAIGNAGSANALVEGSSIPINTAPGATNTLAVVAVGSQMHLYVNGQFFTILDDARYPSGGLALTGYDGSHVTDVRFNNASIWSLPGSIPASLP